MGNITKERKEVNIVITFLSADVSRYFYKHMNSALAGSLQSLDGNHRRWTDKDMTKTQQHNRLISIETIAGESVARMIPALFLFGSVKFYLAGVFEGGKGQQPKL